MRFRLFCRGRGPAYVAPSPYKEASKLLAEAGGQAAEATRRPRRAIVNTPGRRGWSS